MGNVITAYPQEYLDHHEIFDEQFKDRTEALRTAKGLRKQGYTVKVTKICPFSEEIWCVEGEKRI